MHLEKHDDENHAQFLNLSLLNLHITAIRLPSMPKGLISIRFPIDVSGELGATEEGHRPDERQGRGGRIYEAVQLMEL